LPAETRRLADIGRRAARHYVAVRPDQAEGRLLLPYFSASARRLLALLATTDDMPTMTQLNPLAEFDRSLILASVAKEASGPRRPASTPGRKPSWRRTSGSRRSSAATAAIKRCGKSPAATMSVALLDGD
jgi:hypothetical protein